MPAIAGPASAMKCKYRFPVKGKIRLTENVPIPCRGWTVYLETTAGFLSHVAVTVPLPNRTDWPTVEQNPSPGVKLHINPKTPHLPFVQRELRSLQGLLSLFGLESIDFESAEFEWMPESEQEGLDLALPSFKTCRKRLPDDEILPISFDIVARSVIAADAATEIEVPLNFFRRGMIDVFERNYIDAVYDFYFVIETVFAAGKFKKAATLEEFRNSELLRSCVQRALSVPSPMLATERDTLEQFRRAYGALSVDQALEKIFDLRGYLHHHTVKRRDTWHPDEQRAFETDALFLQAVTFNVVFKMAEPYLWAEDVVNAYDELARQYRGGGSDDAAD